jgi:hypothetical protein
MVIVMPPGYGIVDKTGWLSDKIVTDPEILAKVHASQMESIRREHPNETIIDLTPAGNAAANGQSVEKPEAEAPLTYTVTGATGKTSVGTGLSSFEEVLAVLMGNSGHTAEVRVTDLGNNSIDDLLEKINALSL